MKIAIIDYGAGNVKSVQYALQRNQVESVLTNNPNELKASQGVILPGVGHANFAMNNLKATGLIDCIKSLNQPVLGICLGMQLMCDSTAEGDISGLGIFNTKVVRFESSQKVPQMGWNSVKNEGCELLEGIDDEAYFYFVHSYFAELSDHSSGTTNYGQNFSSILQNENYYGCQFHPEKSGAIGDQFLKNFIQLCK